MAQLDQLKTVLKRDGLYVEEKFEEWVSLARTTGQTLDRILTAAGYLTEKQMLQVFGECLRLPVVDVLAEAVVPARFVEKVPVHFARSHNLIGLEEINGTIRVASCSPLDTHPIDELSALLDRVVEPVLAPRGEITSLINRAYQQKTDLVDEALEDLDEDELAGISKEIERSTDLLDIANKAPIIKLVNMILFQALKMRASDVHIQPYEEKLQVRFRIDGILYDMMTPPKKIQEAIISRVKIMGKMDIAERRLPQDGRATVKLGDSEVDIRISSVPTNHGERLVLRLLDKGARLYELEELGLELEDREIIKKLIDASHGIVLVTGPTGSGKTTSLYAALKRINATEYNIMTIEDPIEYHLPGVSQIEVNYKKGLTFATGLRSLVRQDPDIIFVGEIRDEDTAGIAIQASLTGHLVFSTLHTNDAPGAVTRLIDIGVEPYLVASSVIGVVAQRLVRLICKHCKEEMDVTPDELKQIGLKAEQVPTLRLWRGRGCPHCLNSGYLDRTAIYEIFTVTDLVRDQIMAKAQVTQIKAGALKRGMRTLRMDGARKVLKGQTTVEEVLRVTQMDTF
ncbi:MAG TPA: type II secretion system ATPase GspE [Planctomycetota bacterium]|nr:type II secretion system ATPase GspE [Planctomycetota bacterium]